MKGKPVALELLLVRSPAKARRFVTSDAVLVVSGPRPEDKYAARRMDPARRGPCLVWGQQSRPYAKLRSPQRLGFRLRASSRRLQRRVLPALRPVHTARLRGSCESPARGDRRAKLRSRLRSTRAPILRRRPVRPAGGRLSAMPCSVASVRRVAATASATAIGSEHPVARASFACVDYRCTRWRALAERSAPGASGVTVESLSSRIVGVPSGSTSSTSAAAGTGTAAARSASSTPKRRSESGRCSPARRRERRSRLEDPCTGASFRLPGQRGPPGERRDHHRSSHIASIVVAPPSSIARDDRGSGNGIVATKRVVAACPSVGCTTVHIRQAATTPSRLPGSRVRRARRLAAIPQRCPAPGPSRVAPFPAG